MFHTFQSHGYFGKSCHGPAPLRTCPPSMVETGRKRPLLRAAQSRLNVVTDVSRVKKGSTRHDESEQPFDDSRSVPNSHSAPNTALI
jgi:hypothetical protein